MRLVQQAANTADFDVLSDDVPVFRVLVPEHIQAGGMEAVHGVHMIHSSWESLLDGMKGTFRACDELEVTTTVTTSGETEVEICISFKNLSDHDLTDLDADICTALNHLPGTPGWANLSFFGGVPLDRDIQGIMWYEDIAPRRLLALTDDGWAAMHPSPDSAGAEGVPRYNRVRSDAPGAIGCAVSGPDGESHFFQMWKTDCYYRNTFPGNACMHLVPVVCAGLAPGKIAEIRGVVGFFEGSRDALARRMRQFRAGD